MSNVIAGYATIVATAAVVWQAVTYALARRPRLVLKFLAVIMPMDEAAEQALLRVVEGQASSVRWFADILLVARRGCTFTSPGSGSFSASPMADAAGTP